MFEKGACLLISGPSGSGKSTLIKELQKRFDDIHFSISTTTRPMREGEKDGVDYHFVSKEEFQKDIEAGQFLEWANVHGNYYGTSLRPVAEAIDAGKLVVFDIDVQGFEAVMKSPLAKITTSVFVTTPTMEELRRRLEARSSDDAATIERRLQNAKEEMVWMPRYDYILINHDLERSKKQILALAEAARLKRSGEEIEAFIKEWARKGD
jgi:guanylate kinase